MDSVFSRSEYFFPPSNPKPPSLGPTMIHFTTTGILDLVNRPKRNFVYFYRTGIRKLNYMLPPGFEPGITALRGQYA